MNTKDLNRQAEHSFAVKNRSNISLCGITEVVSFESECIVMKTSLGMLTLDGAELNVTLLDLDKGNVEIDGQICALYYIDAKAEKGGLFSRLFK